jgi:putative membrane protein insertion efficiency factor
MARLLILLIKLYQYTLSPLLGNCCRFYPSCSDYALLALRKHGALKGVWLALKRVGKCGPWHKGGVDQP